MENIETVKINPIFKQRSYDTMNKHIEKLNSNKNKYTHLLLGDSLFENFTIENGALSFYDTIGNENIFNASVGGDKVENIIYRLIESRLFDHINLQNLCNIFILAGTNNLNNKKQEICKQIIIEGIITIIEHVKIKLNINLNIYILKIPPRTDIKIELINEVNQSLKKIIDNYGNEKIKLYFIDWTSEFYNIETKSINKKYYFDHVHINELGYNILSKYLIDNLPIKM
jgi:lysophospholipase L1-like esterase